MTIAPPPPPSFPAIPLKKLRSSQASPFLKNWLEVQPPPPAERGGGAHYGQRSSK